MPRVRTVCTTVGGRCKWIVRSRERRTDDGEFVEEIFEAVVVATGNFSLPRIPKIRGKVFTKLFLLDFAAVLASVLCSSGMEWKRKQFHSHVYKVPHPFQNEEVVVVGGAISGPEIAQDDVPIDSPEPRISCKLIAVHAELQKTKPVEEPQKLLRARGTRISKVDQDSGRHDVWGIPEVC
ncbi:hypothetical protein ZIOFF_016723 [Zingiber officinale]|uniref:Flavin-containing monooxygenase n=1 Tax=Zingiber officinale TaxID=94328 RepID=A0A8J5HM34_ZINOF|nr:hypothetical protein ZIOFF_016723 [Zingiber officinale]